MRAANRPILFVGLTFAHVASAGTAPAAQPIAPQGSSRIISGPVTVAMTLRVATPAENDPAHISRCSGGWTTCSVVDSLAITVAGQPVMVPARAVLPLADIATARIASLGPKGFELVLDGGDAGASYEARLFFDRHMLRRMEIWQREMNRIEQATDYHDIADDRTDR